MLDEIYSWLESYCGASYDFNESIQELNQTNACIDPFGWKTTIDLILDQLDDANEVIDNFKNAIPTDLPPAKKMKRILLENMLGSVVSSVRKTANQLNITLDEIKTVDQLNEIVDTIYDLLTMVIGYDIKDIITTQWEKHNDPENEDENEFTNVLSISKQDISSIAMNVNSIRDAYYDSLDAEDSDDMY